jgi:hypothetical protein
MYLTVYLVLQSRAQWRRRLGHLQLSLRLAKQRHYRLSIGLQPLLARSHCCVSGNVIQREEGTLAIDEGQDSCSTK